MKFKKVLSVLISLALIIHSILPGYGYVLLAKAQEATASPSSDPAPTAEPTSEPSASASSEPTTQASSEPTLVDSPTTPIPSPTPPPYWSEEYDVWKAEQDRLDAEAEARDVEWEANEEDDAWVAAHGGEEIYYTSGAWQADQDATAAAAAAEEDPFASESQTTSDTHPQSCEEQSSDPILGGEATTSSEGTVDNSATSVDSDITNVSNNNCASVENDTLASGTSGENAQTLNDSDVSMGTGDSSANGTLVNQGNINTTNSDDLGQASASTNDSFAQGSEAENLSTGDDSENLALGTETDNLAVDNGNTAYVDNQMTVGATSGANVVTDNDGDATLTTGDLELIANMLNILNLNITGEDFLHLIVNIFGTLNGPLDLDDIASILGYADDDALEIIAENDDMGEDSVNTAEATKNEMTDINNSNTAVVNNEMNVSGVSGGNDVSGNDGTADVVTGRIQILANIMNFINANFSGEKWSFIMINIFGGLMGDIILPGTDQYLGEREIGSAAYNTNPGEDSINNQSATSTETTSATNTNGVSLTNDVNADGVSGNNEQNLNDDGGHTTVTGGVDVVTQIMNFLNFNITGNNWVFLIVNVFGTWMGKIVGFADLGIMDAPTGGSFAALSVGGGGTATTAANTNTGEGSENTATATYTSDTNINNQNSADVTNTMNIEGISGENSVNGNDGTTHLTTGWVEISANLLNIINMNVAGRSWMIVFLNVFGDFVGNMFFGQTAADAFAAQMAQTAEATEVTVQAVAEEASQNLASTSAGGVQNQTQSEAGTDEVGEVVGSAVSSQGSGFILSADGESESQDILSFNATQAPEEFGHEDILLTFWERVEVWFNGVLIAIVEFFQPVFAFFEKPLLAFSE